MSHLFPLNPGSQVQLKVLAVPFTKTSSQTPFLEHVSFRAHQVVSKYK